MVMGVPVVSRLIRQELKPSAVSGLETTAQVCYVLYWEPQDLCRRVCMFKILGNHGSVQSFPHFHNKTVSPFELGTALDACNKRTQLLVLTLLDQHQNRLALASAV